MKRILTTKATKAPMSPSPPLNEVFSNPPPEDCSHELRIQMPESLLQQQKKNREIRAKNN